VIEFAPPDRFGLTCADLHREKRAHGYFASLSVGTKTIYRAVTDIPYQFARMRDLVLDRRGFGLRIALYGQASRHGGGKGLAH
jgi:hypothetical protein